MNASRFRLFSFTMLFLAALGHLRGGGAIRRVAGAPWHCNLLDTKSVRSMDLSLKGNRLKTQIRELGGVARSINTAEFMEHVDGVLESDHVKLAI